MAETGTVPTENVYAEATAGKGRPFEEGIGRPSQVTTTCRLAGFPRISVRGRSTKIKPTDIFSLTTV